MIDNLDVLLAALDGLRQAGVPAEIDGCDLTPRRMYVRVVSPAVRALAPGLLAGYRSPFTGQSGADNPVVFAGWVLSNSETGCGAFTITPRLVVQVCGNGMTITHDALRAVHLGGRLDDGVIRWSGDTQQRNLDLITAQARDAVTTFLDTSYVEKKIAEMSQAAGQPVADPQATVEIVCQRLRFTDEQQKTILAHFIRGGDLTAGGVMHAVTSTAQTLRRRRHGARDGSAGAARARARRPRVTRCRPAGPGRMARPRRGLRDGRRRQVRVRHRALAARCWPRSRVDPSTRPAGLADPAGLLRLPRPFWRLSCPITR